MKTQKTSSLPDEVIMEILTRVPANDVLKFRRVCRRWKDLISTQYFIQMHLKASANRCPMIVVQDKFGYWRNELLVLQNWEQPRRSTLIQKVRFNFIPSSFCFSFSSAGLLVMRDYNSGPRSSDFIILNPISGDHVKIRCGIMVFDIYGMFFNPLIEECCVILGLLEGPNVEFKMLNLGPQPCCRILKQPDSFLHMPRNPVYDPPVVVDDATIYWVVQPRYRPNHNADYPSCEELIMGFDVKMEIFTFMPHPGPTDDCHHSEHLNMHILKMNGRLAFLQITTTTKSVIVNIWTLKDSAHKLWIKSHTVPIDMDQLDIDVGGLRAESFGVMAVENGELLLQYSYKSVYTCNLELGSVRKIVRRCNYINNMSSYAPSFVPLRNCKPQIWL